MQFSGRERVYKKKDEGEWTGKVEMRTRKTLLAVCKASVATAGFIKKTSVSSADRAQELCKS